jgi:hypothetical protein
LGVEIDWSTIPLTDVDLKAICCSGGIPNYGLEWNVAQLIPLAWKPPIDPPAAKTYFDFLLIPSYQHLRTPPSNRVDFDNVNIVLKVLVEPHVE